MVTIRERNKAIEKFVESELFGCQTSLIEELFKKHIFSVDEIENLYRPFDAKLISPERCIHCGSNFAYLDSETGECEECFEDNKMPQEVFEWWLVSPWFGKKLLMEGEPVIDNGYGVWWGRTTTGQAITLDYVIQQVYDDLIR